jgi:hypothetical protein
MVYNRTGYTGGVVDRLVLVTPHDKFTKKKERKKQYNTQANLHSFIGPIQNVHHRYLCPSQIIALDIDY